MSWKEVTVLVERAQAGDRAAYGELVRRFQGSVYAMALTRVRDPVEAQELAQEVFVHAMRKLPQLRDPRCFAGWLRRITARMAINRLTRRGPLSGAEPEMLDSVEAGAAGRSRSSSAARREAELHDGPGAAEGRWTGRRWRRSTCAGRSLKQMSREFEAPVGTIKRRLHVARLRLKEVLEGNTPSGIDEASASFTDGELMTAV